MALLRVILREPLVHFAFLALLVFAGYGLVSTETVKEPDRIIVSAAKVDQLAAVFAKTWQRPPIAKELKGLIDDYVKEEIYVREALALGLEEDDTVIRRRLRQKMEFLTAAEAEAASADDAELETYLQSHPERFRAEPMLAFEHIFLNPERHGEKIEQHARKLLESLHADPQTEAAAIGDSTLLPATLPLSGISAINQIFGADFGEAVDALEPHKWSGPVPSSFGLHLVRVSQREAARMPMLSDVRQAVLREWTNDRREQSEARRFAELLKRYQVTVEMPSALDAGQ
jgi:hypothetical protein